MPLPTLRIFSKWLALDGISLCGSIDSFSLKA
jgi:hypothetical protein